MATSGNATWEIASTALVSAAYRKLGYLAEGQTLGATALANGVEALNAIVSWFETKGMPLWKRTTLAITLVAGTSSYSLVEAAIKLPQVNIIDTTSGTKYPLMPKSLYDFNNLPTLSTGIPVHYTWTPAITNGVPTITVWPIPDATAASAKTLSAVYQKKFDGFFSATDTLDFPAYWTQAIIFKLAESLAPETGLPPQDMARLKVLADEAMAGAEGYMDESISSFFVTPDSQ